MNSGGSPNSPDLHHISKHSQDSKNLLTQMKIGNGSQNLNYPVYSFIREKNRQCNLLFVFLMVSGIFMYSLCSALPWEPIQELPAGESRNVRHQSSKPRETVLVSRTCNVLGTATASYCHGAQKREYFLRYFKDLYSEKYVANVLIFPCIPSEYPYFWMLSSEYFPPPKLHSVHPVEEKKKQLLTINYNHPNPFPSFHS